MGNMFGWRTVPGMEREIMACLIRSQRSTTTRSFNSFLNPLSIYNIHTRPHPSGPLYGVPPYPPTPLAD